MIRYLAKINVMLIAKRELIRETKTIGFALHHAVDKASRVASKYSMQMANDL